MSGDKFVTKDSGERQTFSTGMQRDSAQKDLRPDLVYGPMLIRWAELMGRGANKYGERNWEKARTEEELARFRASAFRHFVQWFYGMNPEEDHAAAVFFNIAGAEYVKTRIAEEESIQVGASSSVLSEEEWKKLVRGAVLDPPDFDPGAPTTFAFGDAVEVDACYSSFHGARGKITTPLQQSGAYGVTLEGHSTMYFTPKELRRLDPG